MPTYPYRCSQCGHEFDVFQKISDPPQASCPQCASQEAVRQIAGGSALFQFKGSGFYGTDYKNKKEETGSTKHEHGSSHGGGCRSCGKPSSGGSCSSSE